MRQIGLGVVGLGRAFTLMLPTFVKDSRFKLVAAATPGFEARQAFTRHFGGRAYTDAAALCQDQDVEAIYIASPHQFHREHVCLAAAAGRHVLIDKPLAISMDEAHHMVEASTAHDIHLIVGPSHSFDAPVLTAAEIIKSERFGRVKMIHAMNYTDFLYRPRRPEELDTGQGGGVVFSQAIHQVDVVRLLGGGRVAQVQALTGAWDPNRPTEGAYSALLSFENGAYASLTYSGYGHFDSDEFMGWIGELGHRKNPEDYGRARRLLSASHSSEQETALKRARNFGHNDLATYTGSQPETHEHFGLVIVSCEHADVRLEPDAVMIYSDNEKARVTLDPPTIPRIEVMNELYDAIVQNTPPLHSGDWGRASLETALAILTSASERRPITMNWQVDACTSNRRK